MLDRRMCKRSALRRETEGDSARWPRERAIGAGESESKARPPGLLTPPAPASLSYLRQRKSSQPSRTYDRRALTRPIRSVSLYGREILTGRKLVPDPEAPARFALMLGSLLEGLYAIGIEHETAWRLVQKVAFHSMPAQRRQAIRLEEDEDGRSDAWRLAAWTRDKYRESTVPGTSKSTSYLSQVHRRR